MAFRDKFVFMIKNKESIGILGGMGPEATALFYQNVVKQCQVQYGARNDEDYPEMFIYNLPIPPVIDAIKERNKTLSLLTSGIEKLKNIGSDFIVIPCNTVHFFYDELVSNSNLPILNIIKETAKKIIDRKIKSVGLMATTSSINNNLYQKIFSNYGIEILLPERQNKINEIVTNILSGDKKEVDKDTLIEISKSLISSGAEGIILGCTELPIILNQNDVGFELFDSIGILAESTVKKALKILK